MRTSIPIRGRWCHVYRCQEKHYTKNMGYARFCFFCSIWLTSEESWRDHCEKHITDQSIPVRCNPVTYRRAIACAGYCPIHLSRADLPAETRLCQWSDKGAWKRHIATCFSTYLIRHRDLPSTPCPHPNCHMEFSSDTEFWYHQSDIHSITNSTELASKRKASINTSRYLDIL